MKPDEPPLIVTLAQDFLIFLLGGLFIAGALLIGVALGALILMIATGGAHE